MKTSLATLTGILILSGCAALHAQSPSDQARKPAPGYSDGHDHKKDDPYVRALPKEAEAALAKAGVKDSTIVAAIDQDGVIRLLIPENVKHDRVTFDQKNPLANKGLTGLGSISLASYQGSHCYVWSDGTVVDKNGNIVIQGRGGGFVSGGTAYSVFCLVYHQH
ncbi:hypothetical protein [Nitrosovibrio sp. Nv17]|uniref:hypothetical protein n=1 Tax=Nitrosovibrio sp. Nv17 TaxID=1855339 RepID=UPI0009091741|nr:hypothetical protein [Nitrosovibrio sp. Nv17]SFW31944.1 hypothetical protein SAMN05216414_1162 [Nitrosovibrio sp. Nv17]